MPLLENLFAPGTMERLGWMLVHVLWQATAVAILLAVFLRLLRSAGANIRYAAACSALALMVVLPLATMHYLQTPGPVAEAGPASVAVALSAVTEGATPKRSLSVPDSGHALNAEDTLKASWSVPPLAQAPEPMTPVPLRERIVSTLEPALPYVVVGWLIGVFGLSAWHLGGWTQLQRLKRRVVREIGDPLQRRLEELSDRLGLHRAVGLLESALVEVPTVVGWLRPVVLLPASALTGLRPEQLEAILAHELAHIRRYDYLVNMLQTVVEILGFYHPAIWWVSRRVRIERENCCDDLAVYVCGSSLQYAKALACMEEIRHGGTDLAVAATGGSLMARIARLLGRPAVEDRRFAWLPGLVTLLLVAGLILPAALVLGTPDAAPVPPSGKDIANVEAGEMTEGASGAARVAETPKPQADAAPPQEPRDRLAEAAADEGAASDTAAARESKAVESAPLRPNSDSPSPVSSDQAGRVVLSFKIAKVWSDLRPDRETLLLLANALGVESPLTRELGRPGRQLDMTLGEVLRRYIVPQSLSEPAAQALLDLLQSRGYLKMQAEPQVVAQDNKQAQVRITIDEHFWMPPGSSKLERIAYGTAVDVTPHLVGDNRVALDMMVELTEPVPGVEDGNQPKVSRTSAETSMIAPHDRYLVWAAMEQAASQMEADQGRQSLYVMVKPVIFQPASGYAGPAGSRESTATHPQQVLLDVRTVAMERAGLLNLGVEWSWPMVKTGAFPPPSADSATSPSRSSNWPYGVRIGYTPDQTFTNSLLMALDLLQENGQAHVSGQQILAQDGRRSQIKALTEEWYTVTAPATKESPQSHTETHKTETGTVVAITPRLGDNGTITLEMAIEASTSLPHKGSNLPLVTRRTAKNAVTIRDGGTVAVAGMTENRAGSNDKPARETATFVTVHLIPDVNEAAPPTPPPAGMISPEQQMVLRQEYVNSDPIVREAAKRIVKAEQELIALRQKLTSTHPEVVQKNKLLEALRETLDEKRTELQEQFNQGLAERSRASTGRSSQDATVTATFADTDLRSVLAELSQRTAVPIIVDPNVSGTVTVSFEDLSLDEALQLVLAGKPYVFKKAPYYYLVAVRSTNSPLFSGDVETRRLRLSYAPALRAKALLSPVFAPYVQVEPSGTQDPNDQGNTLIITAAPGLIDRIVEDIKEIDRFKRQVFLDARVVVLEPNELPNLGLEWKRPPVPSMTSSPGTSPKTIVPPIGTAPDRAATDSLMMALSLLQENHRADIIANPKVIAQHGRQAQMKVIQEEWFMMTVPSTSDPFYMREEARKIESGTVMTITPRVGDNNDIMLEMAVEVTDSIPKAHAGSDLPVVTRRTLKNALTIKDGGTVVVSGLIENRSKSGGKRAPVLADIPSLGELFQNRSNDKSGRELVAFITAHLVPDTGARTPPAPESAQTAVRVPPPTSESGPGREGPDRSEFPAPTANQEPGRSSVLVGARFVSAGERLLKDLRGRGAIRGVTSPQETEGLHEIGRRLSEGKSLVLADKQAGLLMKAIQKYPDCAVLAAPQVVVRENEPAFVWIGSKIPYTAGYEEPNEPAGVPKPRRATLDTGWKFETTAHLVGPGGVRLDSMLRLTTLLGFDEKKYQGRYRYQVPKTEDVVLSLDNPVVPSGGTSLTLGPKARRKASDRPQTILILVTPSIVEAERSPEAADPVADPPDSRV